MPPLPLPLWGVSAERAELGPRGGRIGLKFEAQGELAVNKRQDLHDVAHDDAVDRAKHHAARHVRERAGRLGEHVRDGDLVVAGLRVLDAELPQGRVAVHDANERIGR